MLRLLLAEPQHLEIDIGFLERGEVVVATVEGEPAGFASYLVGGSDEAELDGMFVQPEFWRRGLGKLMFRAVERELSGRQATAIRVVAGMSAVDFYKAVGFEIIGEEKTPLGPVMPVMRKALR
ncbi:GNAT family N-acetyltransferase (plasmid) [Devosia sp. A8/3-2]|nr:GNAT family N-acetyltransferase [Devosia sp. A8/3-2]